MACFSMYTGRILRVPWILLNKIRFRFLFIFRQFVRIYLYLFAFICIKNTPASKLQPKIQFQSASGINRQSQLQQHKSVTKLESKYFCCSSPFTRPWHLAACATHSIEFPWKRLPVLQRSSLSVKTAMRCIFC